MPWSFTSSLIKEPVVEVNGVYVGNKVALSPLLAQLNYETIQKWVLVYLSFPVCNTNALYIMIEVLLHLTL
jgi:hypothetical protein